MSAIRFCQVARLSAQERVDLRQSVDSWRLDWLRATLEKIILAGALARGATLETAITLMKAVTAGSVHPGLAGAAAAPFRQRLMILSALPSKKPPPLAGG